MNRRKRTAPETCPQCGADVSPGARVCPECGSCEETGWSEDARYDALDLPNQEFDYDDFVQREFQPEKSRQPGRRWVWWVAVLLMLAAVIGWLL